MRPRWYTKHALIVLAAVTLPGVAAAQQRVPDPADRIERSIRMGHTALPPLVPVPFTPPAAPYAVFRLTTWDRYIEEWTAATRARLDAELASRLRLQRPPGRLADRRRDEIADRDRDRDRPGRPLADALAPDTVAWLPPLIQRDTTGTEVAGVMANLGMHVTGRGELGGAWTKFTPCDIALRSTCDPSLFPQLKPDMQFGVRVGGSINERVHIDVDYDQRREFDAANNINVYYQGRPDEILQRLEVGDVSINLPPSRFLTQGIPAGNFGFRAAGQLGPIQFQSVFAQQKGDVSEREFRLAGGGAQAQDGLVQDAEVIIDDADYVKGQFFFLMDPLQLANAPHVDVLNLRATDIPAAVRPKRGGTILIFRDERVTAQSTQQQGQIGYFLADAKTPDDGVTHSGLFRRLTQDQDYTVHSSGAWILLRSPLRSDEALAVAYETESGEFIGDVNAEQAAAGTTPVLRLVRPPLAQHQPGSPTWQLEMHNIYRLDSSSGVDLTSVDLRISLGEINGGRTYASVGAEQVPYLKLFGLDEDSPEDRIDEGQVYQPARETGSIATGAAPFHGTYIVFPTLEPFEEPPPVPSAGLSAAQAGAALGNDANTTIYNNVDFVARENGARFRLNFDYRVAIEGLLSTFNLGAFGIRENSERIRIGDTQLERNVDYTIDYDLGIVTLNDAQTIFSLNPGAEVRATWEQQSLFQIAPTSVFGLNARYDLGERGQLNLVSLFQAETSLMNRPQLGTEPGSIFLSGLSGNIELGGALIDRALDILPGLRTGDPTRVRLEGEVALSAPNPNTRGTAYLDDFEASDEIQLDVRRSSWRLGSRPSSTDGESQLFPFTLDASTAAPLVWQHDFTTTQGIGGSVPANQIDRNIAIAGTPVPQPAMWLTFGADSLANTSPRWRSITTVLSTTGRDMTRTEYLEFYVRSRDDIPRALVFDIGTVGEDAFYVGPNGGTSGTYEENGRRWGLGSLDEEARLTEREPWGEQQDALGLWDQPCRAEPGKAYPLGDPLSNCTRSNGFNDTEDLDGSGILNPDDGAHFRYVVRLDGLSPYLVKDTAQTRTQYRLYRVPLRNGLPINGATDGTWRFVKHLRMTVIGDAQTGTIETRSIALARMRLVGSRWTKREITGIRRGMLDDESGVGSGTSELEVGPISSLTDPTYTSPPGVRNELADPTAQFGGGAIEFNEKSLRITYRDLQPQDRAEVFYRYPQQPRNLLNYRTMHLWAVAVEGNWGVADGERLVVKVGTDARNYYLYQTRLNNAPGRGNISEASWQPQLTIDFQQWFALKAEAEQLLIGAGSGRADTLWSADSTYAIVLEDRARAPNLAAVREISFAVYNGNTMSSTGEIWLDELRLGTALTDPGFASNVRLDMAGDFLRGSVGYTGRGPVFRQLNEDASYLGSGDMNANVTANMERLLPSSWGIAAPLTVTHTASGKDPQFLDRSDVDAKRLEGLRPTEAQQTTVAFSLRKQTPTANPWLGLLLDGIGISFRYATAETNTVTNRNAADGFDGAVNWRRELRRRDFDFFPGFVEAALRALAPATLERSDVFGRLVGARFRWSPATLTFGTSYHTQEAFATRYESILDLPGLPDATPTRSPREGLNTDLQIGFRPFAPLTFDVNVESDRDLLAPEEATRRTHERDALRAARAELGGVDIGWETSRALSTTLGFRPEIAPWLQPSYSITSRFSMDRNPSYLEVTESAPGDTTAILQRKFQGDRNVARTVRLRPALLFAVADSAAGTVERTLRSLGRAFQSFDVAWNSTLGSSYDRESFAPGIGYQFGVGDLETWRFIHGDTAASARTRDEQRITSTFRLPIGAQLDLTFRDVQSDGFDQRGGTRTLTERAWPGARISIPRVPLPAGVSRIIPNVSISGGFERVERASFLGEDDELGRGSTEDRIPVQVSVAFAKGIAASYTGSFAAGDSRDPTGDGETASISHVAQVSTSFMAPRSWRNRFKRPITSTLSYNGQTQQACRFRAVALDGATECVKYVGVDTRTLNLNLESVLSDLNVGLLLSYTARTNEVGLRNGSDQFQLGVYAGFDFMAGVMPR